MYKNRIICLQIVAFNRKIYSYMRTDKKGAGETRNISAREVGERKLSQEGEAGRVGNRGLSQGGGEVYRLGRLASGGYRRRERRSGEGKCIGWASW